MFNTIAGFTYFFLIASFLINYEKFDLKINPRNQFGKYANIVLKLHLIKMDSLNEIWVKFENEKVFVQVYQVTILFCNEYILN